MLKELIKNNFLSLLIIIVLVICYLNGCFKPTPPAAPIITVVHDTVWIHHDSTVYSKPTVIVSKPPTSIPPEYKPDTNYNELVKQYGDLLMEHFSTNISTDTLKVDSLGYVATMDTITQNKITGRKWDYSLKERVVTNTITIKEPYKPRNQVYIGGGLGITPNPVVSGGLLFKNKRDFVIQPSITYNLTQAKFGINVSAFSLIKLHK